MSVVEVTARSVRAGVWAALCLGAAGCATRPLGIAPSSQHAPARAEANALEQGADPLQIEGLLGSLSPAEIESALAPRMPRFARCFGQRSDVVPWLSGAFAMAFRVGTDGHVRRVAPRTSELGDRATERCLLSVAEATTFPKPRGGEAEFAWSLEAPPDPEVRPADAYPGVERALPTLSSAVRDCAAPALQVTAYVDENGQIVAAGAASPEAVESAALDCVTRSLVGVTLVSPGSYAAKLSAVLP